MPPCQERYANTHTQMWRKKHGDRPPPSFCPLVLDCTVGGHLTPPLSPAGRWRDSCLPPQGPQCPGRQLSKRSWPAAHSHERGVPGFLELQAVEGSPLPNLHAIPALPGQQAEDWLLRHPLRTGKSIMS